MPRASLNVRTSCSNALFFCSNSRTIPSRFSLPLDSSSSRCSLSMSSLVRALIARCASRSFARFLASCEGVRVETLLVPVFARKATCQASCTLDCPRGGWYSTLTFPLHRSWLVFPGSSSRRRPSHLELLVVVSICGTVG